MFVSMSFSYTIQSLILISIAGVGGGEGTPGLVSALTGSTSNLVLLLVKPDCLLIQEQKFFMSQKCLIHVSEMGNHSTIIILLSGTYSTIIIPIYICTCTCTLHKITMYSIFVIFVVFVHRSQLGGYFV